MRAFGSSWPCAGALALVGGLAAAAQDGEAVPPPAVAGLQACRSASPVEVKAACYDAALDALLAELESGGVIALTRDEIDEARRESSGLSSFRLPGVGRIAAEEEADQPIAFTIVAHDLGPTGRLSIETDGGQRWVQVGSDFVARLPDPPLAAEARPAFGDSWFVSIGDRSAVRMRREQ